MMDLITRYWVEFLLGLMSSGLTIAVKRIGAKVKEHDSVKLGVQAMLRSQIVSAYEKYNDLGYCPIYARENINELANQYFNLGGNGVVHNLLDKLNDLPTELKEVK